MVLDKTGTLTEDGLQVYGFRAVKGANITQVQDSSAAKPAVEFEKFIETIDHVTHNVNDKDWFTSLQKYEAVKNSQSVKYVEALASCH